MVHFLVSLLLLWTPELHRLDLLFFLSHSWTPAGQGLGPYLHLWPGLEQSWVHALWVYTGKAGGQPGFH